MPDQHTQKPSEVSFIKTSMGNKVSRPATVLLTQVVLLIFAAIWLFSLALNLTTMARNGTSSSPVRIVVGVAVLGSIVFILVLAFWRLAYRRMYGKWISVAALTFLLVIVVYIQIRPPRGPVQPFEYKSWAEVVGAVVTAVGISLFLWLIFTLVFSKKVDSFFRQ